MQSAPYGTGADFFLFWAFPFHVINLLFPAKSPRFRGGLPFFPQAAFYSSAPRLFAPSGTASSHSRLAFSLHRSNTRPPPSQKREPCPGAVALTDGPRHAVCSGRAQRMCLPRREGRFQQIPALPQHKPAGRRLHDAHAPVGGQPVFTAAVHNGTDAPCKGASAERDMRDRGHHAARLRKIVALYPQVVPGKGAAPVALNVSGPARQVDESAVHREPARQRVRHAVYAVAALHRQKAGTAP